MLIIAVIALIGYALDQASKQAAINYLDPSDPPTFLGGLLSLRLYRNPGAAFGMGSNFTVFFTIFAMLALVFVLVFAIPRVATRLQAVTVGLLIVGIAGNLTDRLIREPGPFRGHVIDMFYVPNFSVFNVADICITTAAGLMIIIALLGDRAATSDKNRP